MGIGLAEDNHRAAGSQKAVDELGTETVVVASGRCAENLSDSRQLGHVEGEQRLTDGHVDVDGAGIVGYGSQQGLVDKAVAMPSICFGQGDCPTHETAEGTGLRQRLTVELVNPRLGAVGTDNDERLVLIPSLSNGWGQVEQGRTAGDADDDRLVESLHHTEGIESRRPFVGNGIARDVGALVQVMDDGGIAAAWADDGVTNAVLDEQSRQLVDAFLIAIHRRIYDFLFFSIYDFLFTI